MKSTGNLLTGVLDTTHLTQQLPGRLHRVQKPAEERELEVRVRGF